MDDSQHRWTEPDLLILLVAANRVMIDRVLAGHRAVGLGEVRPKHGFVIRAVAAEEPTINRLAVLLDTSKQAASKLADAMVRRGFLSRFTDPHDRRMTRLRLTAKGERVRTRAITTSAVVERELTRGLGRPSVLELRRALLTLLEQNGAADEALARRARPVW
jgi:DNA-binding MarR family transcriptional regulator